MAHYWAEKKAKNTIQKKISLAIYKTSAHTGTSVEETKPPEQSPNLWGALHTSPNEINPGFYVHLHLVGNNDKNFLNPFSRTPNPCSILDPHGRHWGAGAGAEKAEELGKGLERNSDEKQLRVFSLEKEKGSGAT